MTKEQFQAYCLAQANWWMAYANTPANKKRTVFKGFSDRALSESELIDDAMNTSRNHLQNYWESCNNP